MSRLALSLRSYALLFRQTPVLCQSLKNLQLRSCSLLATETIEPPNGIDGITGTSSTIAPLAASQTKATDLHKTASRLTRFIHALRSALKCSPRRAQELLLNNPELLDHTANFEPVCRVLLEQRITVESILANGFLLASSPAILAKKLPLLHVQRPRDLNDFVPLLRASISRLHKMRKLTARESSVLPGGHRVYYLADRLTLQPHIVAQHMSTHLFMFDLPAEQLVENLDVQLKYNVAPINILRDPWAFRYSHKAIEMRLDRATVGLKDKLMPWMVRCPEQILAKCAIAKIRFTKRLVILYCVIFCFLCG